MTVVPAGTKIPRWRTEWQNLSVTLCKGTGKEDQGTRTPPPASLRGLCVLAKPEEDAHEEGSHQERTPDRSAAGVVSGNGGWPASLPPPLRSCRLTSQSLWRKSHSTAPGQEARQTLQSQVVDPRCTRTNARTLLRGSCRRKELVHFCCAFIPRNCY